MVCIHLHRLCNHLPFNTYRPMGKPDDENFQEVKCEDFTRETN